MGQVVSRDSVGRARVILAGRDENAADLKVTAETAARVHLLRHTEPLGISESTVRSAVVANTHPIQGGNGASVVQFEQRVEGLEVFHSRASVVLDASKNLVSIGSNLGQAGAGAKLTKLTFALPAEKAMANIYSEHFGRTLDAGAVRDLGTVNGGELRGLSVATPRDAHRVYDATSKRVLFPSEHGLTPAYYVEFFSRAPGSREDHAYGYVISAKDGRVLYKASLTQNETFNYRVWAENEALDYIPMDGPFVDYTPHPTGAPNKIQLGYRDINTMPLIAIDGLNKNKDPWLAANKTTTFGNNVHAYSDRTDTHGEDDAGAPTGEGDGFGPGDYEAEVTSDKTFDRKYNPALEPNASPDQIKAAVTQIFYTTNWLHDYWYDSGFDEKSGVAQVDNYGRGGVDKDPMNVEAQDGADFGLGNNANMSTPADGRSPKMQMYVWSALPNNRSLVTTPTAVPFGDWLGSAVFGPQAFDTAGDLAVADVPLACTPPTNVSGKIAVVTRGTCDFTAKALNAQQGGAIGVILINNAAGHAAPNPGLNNKDITIPLLALSLEDGALLRQAIAGGTATRVTLHRGAEGPKHDGTIDNAVVAHEWGHYLHHRLVLCGSKSCSGMSEGWADFTALHMVVREADAPYADKAYALTQYGTSGTLEESAYFGIRRAPYSTDLKKNPFTFKHVRRGAALPTTAPLSPGSADMSEVHNVGEIWAQTLFDGYVNLLNVGPKAGRNFKQSKRQMADYIVAGMKATGIEPTFTEQRDAILATVWATGRKDDFVALAKGFAKRGLGVGAVAPAVAVDSVIDGLEGAVESLDDTKGDLAILEAKVEEAADSCDHDGIIDAGEKGTVTVTVRNAGWSTLANTKVSVTTIDPSIAIGNGGAGTVASVDPFGTAKVTIPITASKSPIGHSVLPVRVTVSNPDAHTPSLTQTFAVAFNSDDAPRTAAVDNVEAATSTWVTAHAGTTLEAFSRKGDPSNHVWHGDNLNVSGEGTLTSPSVIVGTDDFVISFRHRYIFEYGVGPDLLFDGGVLEISEDNGSTWKDVSTYVNPEYTGTLAKSASNPLSERAAWGATSPSYPDYDPVSLNLGKKLSGKTIKVRFRVGSDDNTGAPGWDIDDIGFAGTASLPFASQVDDKAACGAPTPGADAGTGNNEARYTMPDDGCAVSPAPGHSTRNAWGLGLIGGLALLLRRRRRSAR
ncbi:M36 family metallopeptidase [Pendulispora albinea]|uniref:M36 family metallopeptidase n=1 Tax=Pendulispora albinea TaxID=2741071 RepID=A0ABZ2MC78_9BACT